MYRFFVKPENICGNDIYIEGQDFNHIKNALRMKIGEEVSVFEDLSEASSGEGVKDPAGSSDVTEIGREYRCEVAAFEDDRVHLKLRFIKEESVELANKIYLFQGLPKSDKLELIIQKAVELGVYEVIPVRMKRCVVKYDTKKEAAKIERYNAIAKAAAKQSRRGVIPCVKNVMNFTEAVEYCKDMDVRLLPYELADMNAMDKTRELLGSIKEGQSVAVFIGPEGGFDGSEYETALEGGFMPITLGHRILRTETAGMTVLSWLTYLLEK